MQTVPESGLVTKFSESRDKSDASGQTRWTGTLNSLPLVTNELVRWRLVHPLRHDKWSMHLQAGLYDR